MKSFENGDEEERGIETGKGQFCPLIILFLFFSIVLISKIDLLDFGRSLIKKYVADNRDQWGRGYEKFIPESYNDTTVFYVSSINGDDNNDGRQISTPFRTIQRAADETIPASVVLVLVK